MSTDTEPGTSKAIHRALRASKGLGDAENRLAAVSDKLSRAYRWGAWDGFSGRPETFAGLIPSNCEIPPEIKRDYLTGIAMGRQARRQA